jgi:hypothetical protein
MITKHPVDKKGDKMTKQRLEGYVSKELSTIQGIWFQKNMVNQLAYKQSVGDFIILTNNHNYVLECKECNNIDSKGRFELSRLTQLNDLKIFENKLDRNVSLINLMFWGGSVKKSFIFIIPLNDYLYWLEDFSKKSINVKECFELFNNYHIKSFSELSIILLKDEKNEC